MTRDDATGRYPPVALYTKTWLSSGAGLFAQELVRGMIDAGGRVTFIAPPAQDPRFDTPRPGLTRLSSCRERDSGPRWRRALSSLARIGSGALHCLRARSGTRIFIVTIPDPLVLALPILALLRLTGARIIYVVHDPLPHAWKLPARLRPLENSAFAFAYRLSSALVVLSDASVETLRRHYRLGRREVAMIEHGEFALGEGVPAPGDGILLLFGTLRRNKGIREAIEGVIRARARGAAIRLVIAGTPDPVEPDYWAQCHAIAIGHPDAVTLEIGYVEDDRLRQLIAACDAFLLPYRDFHSQSGVAMLAASNARPTIVSCTGGLGDLVRDGMPAVAIEEPVDSEAVAAAIVLFGATGIAEWNRRAAQYRERTSTHRAWPKIGEGYLDLARRVEEG